MTITIKSRNRDNRDFVALFEISWFFGIIVKSWCCHEITKCHKIMAIMKSQNPVISRQFHETVFWTHYKCTSEIETPCIKTKNKIYFWRWFHEIPFASRNPNSLILAHPRQNPEISGIVRFGTNCKKITNLAELCDSSQNRDFGKKSRKWECWPKSRKTRKSEKTRIHGKMA